MKMQEQIMNLKRYSRSKEYARADVELEKYSRKRVCENG